MKTQASQFDKQTAHLLRVLDLTFYTGFVNIIYCIHKY